MKESKEKSILGNYGKLNSNRVLENLTKNIEHYSLCCQRELAQMDQLYQKRMKQQAIVRHFENNNEEYAKIKKTVEEKVHNVLSDRRMVLKLGLLSLIESMKNDPGKYSCLIYHNIPSTANYNSQDYDAASYGQQQQQYPSQDYTDMLLEEAEKLYNKLSKELVDESISDHAYSTSSSSLLPLLPPNEEESQPSSKTSNSS